MALSNFSDLRRNWVMHSNRQSDWKEKQVKKKEICSVIINVSFPLDCDRNMVVDELVGEIRGNWTLPMYVPAYVHVFVIA